MSDLPREPVGTILGLHHVKIPVTDLPRSREWYERVFDLEPHMEFRDDHDGVVRGVVYRALRSAVGEVTISLREQPTAARGLAGFDPLALMLGGRADVEHWCERLDRLGVAHTDIVDAPIGSILAFADPDGIELRFYSLDPDGADPGGRRRIDP
jgi:catechol 2,3-dioxygenase-like lactoylglutathione lyase family enzyme